jgi:hypothetical protein
MRPIAISPVVLVLACGGSGGPAPAPPVSFNCSTDSSNETYTPGLPASGVDGVYDFKLMTMDPEPPSRGNNLWNVEIDSVATGQPVDGLGSNMTVTPYMPTMRHGSPIIVDISDAGEPGMYTFTPINLWMPGIWTVTIDVVDDGSAESDKAVYNFCLSE